MRPMQLRPPRQPQLETTTTQRTGRMTTERTLGLAILAAAALLILSIALNHT
jgi:hypothetical protein